MQKFFILFATVLIALFSLAQSPALVKDIYNVQNNGSITNTANYTAVGSTVFFTAIDGINGFELWKTDGTAAGTVMVKDINPGQISSLPANLINVDGTLYFSAAGTGDNSMGYNIELWKSDGSAAGTVLVKDIYQGIITSQLTSFTNVNGTLFFTANTNTTGFELWKSDGTDAGTVMVKEIFPGNSSQFGYSSFLNNLTNVNGTLFFSAADSLNNNELWKSDGTAAGTLKVKEINSTNGSSPNGLTNINGTLYFSANDGINGIELWKSDGTESGTVMIKNLNPGALSSEPNSFTNVNGTTYFTANDGNGPELFKTDGTAIGTTDFNISTPTSGGLARLNQLNGNLFFIHVTQLFGRELWGLNINSLSTSENITNDNKFSIFPNPVNNILTIQKHDNKSIDQITISDLTGKKVLEQNSNSFTINVEKLQNGMYLLQLFSEGKFTVSKFIKI